MVQLVGVLALAYCVSIIGHSSSPLLHQSDKIIFYVSVMMLCCITETYLYKNNAKIAPYR